MTATDELRRLLDGRGVEWAAIGTDTCWTGADGYPMRAWETTNGTHMRVADLTPKQAVEATLGSDLKAENAELRELLQRTWDTFHDAPAREFFYVKNKLRELGIEVDA